jgi:pyridoxal phosphate enzyme (YggS family)
MNDSRAEADRIAANWQAVRERVDRATSAARRPADSVQIVGITKYVDARLARCLFQAGCHHLGESRPQELWQKADALSDLKPHWHLIGHLQRNKVKRTLQCVDLIQSVDSLRLMSQINSDAESMDRRVAVLIEVNISSEANKTGLAIDSLNDLFDEAMQCSHVEIQGLMGMASVESSTEPDRQQFARLRSIRDELHLRYGSAVQLKHLSMGMSGDFEDAIIEGATIVRIGSALFEGVGKT